MTKFHWNIFSQSKYMKYGPFALMGRHHRIQLSMWLMRYNRDWTWLVTLSWHQWTSRNTLPKSLSVKETLRANNLPTELCWAFISSKLNAERNISVLCLCLHYATILKLLLFISYKFVKGYFGDNFFITCCFSWNFHDVCQRFLYKQKRNFSWIRHKMRNFPIDARCENRPLL